MVPPARRSAPPATCSASSSQLTTLYGSNLSTTRADLRQRRSGGRRLRVRHPGPGAADAGRVQPQPHRADQFRGVQRLRAVGAVRRPRRRAAGRLPDQRPGAGRRRPAGGAELQQLLPADRARSPPPPRSRVRRRTRHNGFLPGGTALPYTVNFQNNPGPAPTSTRSRSSPSSTRASTPRPSSSARSRSAASPSRPAGTSTFTQDIDFTATLGFILRVSAGIDLTQSPASAKWVLQAIDPLTGEPLTGFHSAAC